MLLKKKQDSASPNNVAYICGFDTTFRPRFDYRVTVTSAFYCYNFHFLKSIAVLKWFIFLKGGCRHHLILHCLLVTLCSQFSFSKCVRRLLSVYMASCYSYAVSCSPCRIITTSTTGCVSVRWIRSADVRTNSLNFWYKIKAVQYRWFT